MSVYIVRSEYVDERYDIKDRYVEGVFSSVEKAEEYIREFGKFELETGIYVIDSGLVYHPIPGVDLPRRHFSSKDGLRTLTLYCEHWEVK